MLQLRRRAWPPLVGLVALIGVFWIASAPAQIPDKFTNLKVLPPETAKNELVDLMKSWTFGLGTRCWFCHEGEGDDLSTYDFASDKNPHKNIARRHFRMQMELNEGFFDGEAKINCNTCHQGQAQPAP